jgi:hypothetical protein
MINFKQCVGKIINIKNHQNVVTSKSVGIFGSRYVDLNICDTASMLSIANYINRNIWEQSHFDADKARKIPHASHYLGNIIPSWKINKSQCRRPGNISIHETHKSNVSNKIVCSTSGEWWTHKLLNDVLSTNEVKQFEKTNAQTVKGRREDAVMKSVKYCLLCSWMSQ